MKYQYILFDFDGTVADTKQGIYDSASYTLSQFGITTDKETLRKFVGPTLWHSFETLFGFDRAEQERAVNIYREHYSEIGMFEAELYPNMLSTLKNLKSNGYKLGIASAKNESSVLKACKFLGIYDLFDLILGSFENGERSDKKSLIDALCVGLKVDDMSKCVYIGDSYTDYIGANEHNMDFIAALYDRDESEFDGYECSYKAYEVGDIIKYVM